MNFKPILALVCLVGVLPLAGCGTMGGVLHGDTPETTPLPPVQPPAPPSPGAIYQPGNTIAFMEDPIAHRVGDLITVVLQERTQAQAASSTATGKNDSIDVGIPTLFGHSFKQLNASAATKNAFNGTGTSQQSNQLTGQISVRVVEVLPNGLLKVSGQKQLQINRSDELMTLTGYVATRDIAADNTVPSGRVAMAQINYHGRGALGDANRMGWLARFFNSPLWPF